MRTVRCSGRGQWPIVYSSMHWAGGVYPSMHWAGGCVSQHHWAGGYVSQHALGRGVSAWGSAFPVGWVSAQRVLPDTPSPREQND